MLFSHRTKSDFILSMDKIGFCPIWRIKSDSVLSLDKIGFCPLIVQNWILYTQCTKLDFVHSMYKIGFCTLSVQNWILYTQCTKLDFVHSILSGQNPMLSWQNRIFRTKSKLSWLTFLFTEYFNPLTPAWSPVTTVFASLVWEFFTFVFRDLFFPFYRFRYGESESLGEKIQIKFLKKFYLGSITPFFDVFTKMSV